MIQKCTTFPFIQHFYCLANIFPPHLPFYIFIYLLPLYDNHNVLGNVDFFENVKNCVELLESFVHKAAGRQRVTAQRHN